MSKRAILIISAVNSDGEDVSIKLSLQEYKSTNGKIWEWHLPQHFGWGPNDTGLFNKNISNTGTVSCMSNDKFREVILIRGITPRTLKEFPFTPDDYSDKKSGELDILEENYYLSIGTYNWTLDYVVF